MGSYNRVCAVSKTPIMVGQKARVFFLVVNAFEYYHYRNEKKLFKTSLSESHCYPHENYQIIGYPLLATYQDNNFYEFEDEDMVNVNLDVLNDVYFPNRVHPSKEESDYNTSHDFINIDTLDDMSLVQDMIKSGSLRIMSVNGVSSVVEMAIHEDIYQKLILADGWNRGYYNDKKEDFNSLVDNMMAKYIDSDDLIISNYDKELFEISKKHLMANNDKTLETIRKEYSNMLKLSGNYDVDYSPRDLHNTLTYFKKDIHRYDFPRKIIEASLGALWTNNWFYMNNHEFHTPSTSNADNDPDYVRHLKRHHDIVEVLLHLKLPYEDEEKLVLKETIVRTLTLSKNEIESKILMWFGNDGEAFEDMTTTINKILENKISCFAIGDNSFIDTFFSDYDLLDHSIEQGTIIQLDFF